MTANTEAAVEAAIIAEAAYMNLHAGQTRIDWPDAFSADKQAHIRGATRAGLTAAAPHLVAAVPDGAVEAAVLAAVQAERDACAEIAETLHRNWNHVDVMFDQDTAMQVSYAIRARSAAPLPKGSGI